MARRLTIYQPVDLQAAIDALVRLGEDAKVIAGGTAMSILLRQGLVAPAALVSITGLPDLSGITVDADRVRLGALVTHRRVEISRVVRDAVPVLSRVFGVVASVRVRNQATVGGVLAEADYASDPPAVLVGLDAEVIVAGPAGRRAIPIGLFFRGFFETALEPAELVIEVSIPRPPLGLAAIYHKFVTRSAEDRPCIGVFAACRQVADGSFGDVRVAVGGASETPQRLVEVESLGVGTDLSESVCARIADAYAERVATLEDVRGSAWYRSEMIRVWVRRALASARAEAAA